MADGLTNHILNLDQEHPPHPPEYHVMVLLVDDQAMVCEAVRRALANQTDIDFHYCADARNIVCTCACRACEEQLLRLVLNSVPADQKIMTFSWTAAPEHSWHKRTASKTSLLCCSTWSDAAKAT